MDISIEDNTLEALKNFFPMAQALRILAMDSVEHAGSGHPGMAMGMADVMTVLASCYLKWDPENIDWPDRDRFVLSAGHGALLWYSVLYLWGVISLNQLKQYRQYGSQTPGHPERGHPAGTEVTTGPLGQGIANAVGMALSESLLRKEFSQSLINHYTYAMVGDGCLMEGVAQEAISLAGHWRLHRLIVFWDDNGITIDGPITLSTSDNVTQRFKASGWNTLSIDGHDFNAIYNAIASAQTSCQPTLIGCRTHIAYGAPNKMGSCHSHGSPLGPKEAQATRKALAWPWEEAFFVPKAILEDWKNALKPSITASKAWSASFSQQDPQIQTRFHDALHDVSLTQEGEHQLKIQGIAYGKARPFISTRSASGAVLTALFPHTRIITGAADLKDSTCTSSGIWSPYRPFLHYGIREHAMAAIMNGIAAHGGFIPCGGTFLAFSDYMRPAIRLAALMEIKVIYIMTHDSIGLGEDGPTHQPVEHLISLRAIPNLTVLRPGDSVEVVECWEIALKIKGPVMLCLSRQSLPTFRTEYEEKNRCKSGAYPVLSVKDPQVNMWASGSEVHLALEVAQQLRENHGISVEVFSVPWLMRWLSQYPEPWRSFPAQLHVSLEAASVLGWYQVTGPGGLNMGVETFGASGSSKAVFEAFGFSTKAVTEKILQSIKKK